jgi:putative ABC transport system permease protein
MPLADLTRFAWQALSGHRLRSALSLLGVAIGVTAVIVLTALGEGARRYVIEQFASLGTNLLVVVPGRTETTGAVPGVIGVPNDLTLDDATAVLRGVRLARQVAPISMGTETVSHGDRQRQVAVVGTSRSYLAVRDLHVGQGSFLPAGELDRGAAVVVLGAKVARELFPGEDPLGAVVRVGAWRLRVIGVMAPIGTQLGVDLDEVVLVPVATGLRMFNRRSLFRILVRVAAYSDLDAARQQVRALLAERHGEEDFTALSEDALVSTFASILGALTLALAGIAAVSLTVAGLGIMNVMLVSVSERTGEVGLLRALGAGRRQIAAVFLLEAVFLSALGGLAGLAAGWALVRLLVRLYPALPASPPAWAVAAAVTVSLLVGAVFGLTPARHAARLDPVAALGRR